MLFGLTALLGAACQQKMASQPSYRPLEANDFFPDGRAARPVVAGTVARGHLQTDTALFTGRKPGRPQTPPTPAKPNTATEPEAMSLVALEAEENNNFVDELPMPVTPELLRHGYERFMIYCVVCHDPLGSGHGKIVERGYTPPPSYHVERLRKAPIGRLFAVVSEGYGSMPSYAEQIPVGDRWSIVAYVRALQLSQHFPADKVPADLAKSWPHSAEQKSQEPSP